MSDLIDRQRAITAVQNGFFFHSYAGGMAAAFIKSIPPAMRWIPSAVPPDTDRKVLCLTKTKKGVINYVIGYYDERWCCGMNSNVIAWMDLPEPPEEEQT